MAVPPRRRKAGKIEIEGDQNQFLVSGFAYDGFIGKTLEFLCTQMHRIVAMFAQKCGGARGRTHVQEQPLTFNLP